MWRRIGVGAAFVAVAALLAWALFVWLPHRRPDTRAKAATPAAITSPESTGRKIKARLFYVADDGLRLTGMEREVAYAESQNDQAREILQAQLAPATPPLVSAIPANTGLRAVYVTPQGTAFVDFTRQLSEGQPGGSASEALTVYTIVHALTFNMPAITSVQLLVEGKQIDTLSGHIDLRHPLAKNVALTIEP